MAATEIYLNSNKGGNADTNNHLANILRWIICPVFDLSLMSIILCLVCLLAIQDEKQGLWLYSTPFMEQESKVQQIDPAGLPASLI